MKLGMYTMVPEPISTAYFISPSHRPVCPYVYLLIVARQRLGSHVPEPTNTRNSRIIVGGIVFYVVHVMSKESLLVCLCITISLLGNG
jgi:hypothetical protein